MGKREISNEAENPSEIETVISDDREVAETSNHYILNIVPSLKISPKENYKPDIWNANDPSLNYISKSRNHPTIQLIKSIKKERQTFIFNYVSYEEVLVKSRTCKPQKQHRKTTFQQNL